MTRVTPYSKLSGLCLLSTLLAAPAGADTVFLKNGRSFEDVVAEVHGTEVRIRLPHGELRLSAASVARIDKSETVLAGYLARKAALGTAETKPSPASWLELARWARSQGHEPGVREAVLEAARLDPGLDGLAPFLRQLGFHSQDPETGRWLTETEVMNRRGFVSDGDQWVTREVAEMRENARAQERQARRAEAAESQRRAAEARFERAVTALALREAREAAAEAEEARRRTAPVAVSYVSAGYWHWPVVFPPSVLLPPPPTGPLLDAVPGAQRHDAVQGNSFDYNALVGRQPGSILPMTVDPGRPR